jgi:glycosyltransferase involved in cell wall biosynthesis
MILFLGRLALQKGAWQFLEMAAQVHRLQPDVQFVIAGDGHLFGELVERAISLGLQECVSFAGAVSGPEARSLYGQASCFVMPSLSEPFGLVALEAIAQGTPVILSRQSGAAEVVRHGFAVDFWDTAKMADCALTILRDEPLQKQLTGYAPDVLRHLTWENQASQVHAVYRELLSN